MATFRICRLIVSIQTCRHVLRIADAIEGQLLHHQARDDLSLSRDLQGGFLREQLLLTDEKGKQLDLLPIERIVDITQPLVLVVVVALC
ncbi:hypothetical protein KAF44_29215 (plasmid) [Cupriavidus necator]|nr:hypothetical protein KAF44_29215 [Cupriavidus necator]